MATHVTAPGPEPQIERHAPFVRTQDFTRYLVPLGRLLFVAIFLISSLGNFAPGTIAYAAQHGVPWANVLVPLSGVLALLGGLSILFGVRARIGALLLVLFLVPVTLIMHRYWGLPDPALARLQQVHFMKNLSMLGGALLIMYFGAGPLSFDEQQTARRS
jgi:putative oxidoreductase